jgi:hypothetical protein
MQIKTSKESYFSGAMLRRGRIFHETGLTQGVKIQPQMNPDTDG